MIGQPDTPIFQVGVRRPPKDFTRVRTNVMLTCMDVQHTKHVTYKLAYYFVWCPKYQKKLLVGKLATFIEQAIRRICTANSWTIGALNVQEDHVHLFLSAPPNVSPSQIAHTLKGATARLVFQRFPPRQELSLGRCPSRSRSYYVGQRGRHERGYGVQIDRIGSGLRNIVVVLYRFTLAEKLM